jgi:hypothetical protein
MKKYISLILAVVLVSTGALTDYAYASTTDNGVQFEIYGIADANRIEGSLNSEIYTNAQSVSSEKSCSINTLDCIIYVHSYPAPANPVSVYVDGEYEGNGSEDVGYYSNSVDDYEEGIVLRHLSPGTHEIELRGTVMDKYAYLMPQYVISQKLYVTVPVYEDEHITKALENINNGTATENDYEEVSVNTSKMIGVISLSDLNEKVKGQNLTISNVQSTVYGIIYQYEANQGNADLNQYQALGITGVDSTNLSVVNSAVKSAASANGSNLTLEQIQGIVDSINSTIKKIASGQGTLSDYQTMGITAVTDSTLADVNWYIENNDSSTIGKIANNVTTMLAALRIINSGTTSISYYNTLGITAVTGDSVNQVKTAIVAAAASKGSNLTRSEIETIVENVAGPINSAIEKIANGQGSLSDYQTLGITTVTDSTLADVNWYVSSQNSSTASVISNNVFTILTTLKNVNSGVTTISNYTTLGITTVTSDNMAQVKTAILAAVKAKGSNLTKAEIEKVVSDTVTPLNNAITEIESGNGTLSDYQELGITTVTSSTLGDVNWYVSSKNSSTISTITSNVAVMLSALNSINSGTTATSYYNTLGITTVTSANVTQVKTAILAAVKTKGSNLTKSEIEKVVLNTINGISNTIQKSMVKATVSNNKSVELATTTSSAVTVNDDESIGVTTTTSNNSISEIGSGNGTLSDYQALGITTVTSDNMAQVRIAILAAVQSKGSNLTKEEIEKIISDTINGTSSNATEKSMTKETASDDESAGSTTTTSSSSVTI